MKKQSKQYFLEEYLIVKYVFALTFGFGAIIDERKNHETKSSK